MIKNAPPLTRCRVSLSRTHLAGPSPTRATSATITTITTHPGTVVIEAVHAVVAQAAVRGPRRPEDLAGETVFQLDRLSFDQDLLGPRRRSICGTVQRVWHLYSRRFGLSTHVHTHIFPYSSRATQRKCSISNIDDVDMQVEEK